MFAISITEDQLFDALGAYLTPYLPNGGTVFKSQANRVAQPPDPSIELTPILRPSLSTPRSTYDGVDGTQSVYEPVRFDVQADFRGDSMGDVARAVKTIWRSISAPDTMNAILASLNIEQGVIAPLYCSEEMQSPFVTGERQYSERWTLTLSLQYNATVTIPQQFFTTAPPVKAKAADVLNPVE
jgi:hypothetical protein